MENELQPGMRLARGVCRHFAKRDFATITEYVPTRGLRVDVLAIGPKSEIWVIECKSSRADFTSDHKWQGYLEWCDRFFWCVDAEFPTEILPPETGLIIADDYDAEIISYGPESPLAAARRKAMMLRLARISAYKVQSLIDPSPAVRFSTMLET